MKLFFSTRQTTGLFILAAIALVLVTISNIIFFQRFRSASRDVVHSQEILHTLEKLQSVLADTETGQRGYLLTNNSSYLAPNIIGKAEVWDVYENLEKLIENRTEEERELAEVKPLIVQKINELNLTINLKAHGKTEEALRIVKSNVGKKFMDEIRLILSQMKRQEEDLVAQRDVAFRRESNVRFWSVTFGAGLSLLLLSWMFYIFNSEVEQRKRSQKELEEKEIALQQHASELTSTNKELEAFCYSVSHDLRAPLRGIEGFSRIVVEQYGNVLDDEGKGYLNRVRSGVKKMGELIDELLRLSRITRAQVRPAPVNLADIARSVVDDLQKLEPGRTVEWVIPPTIMVHGDANLLRIALDNLFGNAWKFTSKRPSARIELSEQVIADETVYAVKDNGAGFDMTYRDKLFAAFQRLHSPEEFPGTGIGLATVQRVIHRHGGRVWAEGSVGQGASFFFTLPLKEKL